LTPKSTNEPSEERTTLTAGGSRWRFLTDWETAAARPYATLIGTFVVIAAGFTALAYPTVALRNFFAAAAIGVLSGALFSLWTYTQLQTRGRGKPPLAGPPHRTRFLFDALLVTTGAGLLVFAGATANWRLVFPAIVFVVLGLGLFFARYQRS
jgi:hypothetical protein